MPTAMATTFDRLIDVLGVESEVAEVGTDVAEVADAAVVDAVDAGDGVSVALAVEATVPEVSTNSHLTNSSWTAAWYHVPAVVVTGSPGTPMAQYASKTSMALEA